MRESIVMNKSSKVLVVDDFSTMRKVIRNLLKQLGYENIVEAGDGVMALELLRSQKIDFIIADWNMPNMNGLELLKEVRADAALSRTPFLMVTAESLRDNVIEAVRAGVDNYVVKPFTADVLSEKIAEIEKKYG